jgi:serine protease
VIRIRYELAAAALAGAVALAGCGGGGGGDGSTEPANTTAAAATPTGTTPAKPPPSSGGSGGGNGGGTEPARTELEFRGTKSGVKPRSAAVAPFISVKVTLTSEDGSSHVLRIGSHTAKVGGTRTSAFFTLPGLASGKSYKGTVDGRPLVIRSTSEPGP